MYSFFNNKGRKVGSIGNLNALDPLSNIAGISRSRSFTSLRDASITNSSIDWQIEKSKIDNAMIEKAFLLFKKVEATTYELAESKLILQCVKDVAKNADKKLTQETARKLNIIIDKWEGEKYLKLSSNSQDYNMQLLGIINFPDAELSNMEKIRIKTCVEAKLQDKIQRIVDIYEEEGFNVEEGLKYAENGARDRFMKKCGFEQHYFMEKVTELMENYKESMTNCYEQMERWKDLKVETQNVQLQKASNLKLQAKVAELKAKIIELQVCVKMFNENRSTVEAFTKLNSMLDDKLNSLDKEIQEKKELKKQYDALKGTEFDDIVAKYRQISLATDKLKNLSKELK